MRNINVAEIMRELETVEERLRGLQRMLEVDGKGHYRNTENMIRKLRYKLIDEIELLEMGNH